MHSWLLTLWPPLFRRPPASAAHTRPALEALEDRCVPSANVMPAMGMMGMPPAGTGMMSSPSAGPQPAAASMTGTMEADAMAALETMFVNLEQALQQIVTAELAVLQTLATDFIQMQMAAAAMMPASTTAPPAPPMPMDAITTDAMMMDAMLMGLVGPMGMMG